MRISMQRLKKAILVATYNKTDELRLTLEHIANCQDYLYHQLVIIYHAEVLETSRYVEGLNITNLTRIATDGSSRSKLENINKNRIDGLDYCFEKLGVDYVVAIEDDVLCGYDTLVFCAKMIERYQHKTRFRGVNLGSKEIYEDDRRHQYGLFRYGLFGQGGAITKQVWQRIKSLNLLNEISKDGFDYLVEHFYKSGFVVMPRCSRYIDIGWNGTHSPKDQNNEYYLSLKASWIGVAPVLPSQYCVGVFEYKWRYDCVPYQGKEDLKYALKFQLYRMKIKIKELLCYIGSR